jgi:hypothetical protein
MMRTTLFVAGVLAVSTAVLAQTHNIETPLLVAATLFGASGAQSFAGTITDDICASAGHAQMQMGPTDAECTRACAEAHGAEYVLFDGKSVYALSDQRSSEKFAGQKVNVVGTLDAKTQTIHIDSITAAK